MYFGRILNCIGKCKKGVVKCDTLLDDMVRWDNMNHQETAAVFMCAKSKSFPQNYID